MINLFGKGNYRRNIRSFLPYAIKNPGSTPHKGGVMVHIVVFQIRRSEANTLSEGFLKKTEEASEPNLFPADQADATKCQF